MATHAVEFSRHDDEAWISVQMAMRSKTYSEVMGHVKDSYESHLKARHHRAAIVQIGPETKRSAA